MLALTRVCRKLLPAASQMLCYCSLATTKAQHCLKTLSWSKLPRVSQAYRQVHKRAKEANESVVFVSSNRRYLAASYAAGLISTPILAFNAYLVHSGRLAGAIASPFDEHPLLLTALSFVFGSSLFIVTGVLLRRTFIRIYYNETKKEFTGVQYNWLLADRNIVFKPGDARYIENQSNPARELMGNFIIAGRSYHLSLKDFTSTYHYNLMLGYVQP